MTNSIRVALEIIDADLQANLENDLSRQGYAVLNAFAAPQTTDTVQVADCNVAIVEHREGHVDGMQRMQQLRRQNPSIAVVIVTDQQDSAWCTRATNQGAIHCLCTPINDLAQLGSCVEMATRQASQPDVSRSLEHLVLAGPTISSTTEGEELCRSVHEVVTECVPAVDTFLFAQWDPRLQEVSFPFCIKQGKRIHPGKRSKCRKIIEYVIDTKEPLRLTNGDMEFRNTNGLDSFTIDGDCTSELVVPILLEDGAVYGVIVVLTHDPHIRYDQNHLLVLQTVANQTAGTIQNCRKLKESEDLKEAIASLTGETTIPTVYQIIVDAAHRLVEPDFTGLILQDEDGMLSKVEPTKPPHYFAMFEPPRQQGGLTRKVVQALQPEIIPDTNQRGLVKPEVIEHGIRSMLVMPLIYGGRALGALYAHDLRPRKYTPHDINLWSAFASRAAAALHTAQVNKRSIDDARTLADAIASLTGRMSLSEAMQRIADAAKTVFRADSCRLAYTHPPTGQLIDWTWASDTPDQYRFEEPPRPDGTTNWVIQHREPLFCPDAWAQAKPSGRQELLARGMQSFASIPLTYRGRVVAVLHYNFFTRKREFGERDEALFRTFSAPAAMALDRARRDQTREVWAELYRKMTTCGSPQEVRQHFTETAKRATHADFAVFYSHGFDEHTGMLRCIEDECIHVGNLSGPWKPVRQDIGRGPVHSRIENEPDKLLIINDLDATGESLGSRFARRERVKAHVALHLDVIPEGMSDSRRVGVLFLNYRQPTQFQPSDLLSLRIAGQQAASAILRLQLEWVMREHREQLQLSVGHLMETFLRQRDKKVILDEISKAAVKLLRVEICSVLPFSAEADDFEFEQRGVAGTTGEATGYTPLPVFKTWVQQTDSIIVSDTCTDPYLQFSSFAKSQGIRSVVVCPLHVESQPVGLFFANSRHLHEFTQDEVEEIRLFANLAAMVIQQSRLQRRLQSRTVLTWVSMLEDTWRHSLVTKASTIRNIAGTLNRALPSEHVPDQMANAKVIERIKKIDRLAETIADAPARVPQSWEMEPELVPLGDLLEDIAKKEMVNLQLEERATIEIVSNVESLYKARIICHRRWFIWAIETLFHNSYKAMPEGGTVEISGQRVGSWAEIRIQDSGQGVPAGIRGLLFKELIPQQRDTGGMGLGALLVATMLDELGGSVTLEDPGPSTTTVLVRMPLATEATDSD